MLGESEINPQYEPIEEIKIEPEIDEQFQRVIIKGEARELKKFITALSSKKNQSIDWEMEKIMENMELFEQDEISKISDHGSEILNFGNHIIEIGKTEDFGAETANPESLALAYYYKDKPKISKEEKQKHFEEIKKTFEKVMSGILEQE